MHFLNHHDAKITYGGKKVEIFVEMSTSAWKKTLVWLQAGKEGCSPCRNASSLMTNRLLEGSSLQNKAQAVSFWKQGWLGSRHLVVRALCRNVLRKLQNLSLVCYMLCNSDQQRDDYQPPAIPFQARAVGSSKNPRGTSGNPRPFEGEFVFKTQNLVGTNPLLRRPCKLVCRAWSIRTTTTKRQSCHKLASLSNIKQDFGVAWQY